MVDRIADQAQALWHDGRRPVLQERRLGELELRDRQTEFEPLAVIGETAEPRREVRLDARRSKERKQTHEHKALKALRLKLSEGTRNARPARCRSRWPASRQNPGSRAHSHGRCKSR